MIRMMLYSPANKQFVTGGEELLEAWREQPAALLWADLAQNESAAEQRLLVQEFGLHPLAVEDAQRNRHPPKIESFDNHLLILLKGLGADQREFEFGTVQIALFLGKRFLVTRRSGDSASINKLWEDLLAQPIQMGDGADAMLLRVAGTMVDRYLKKLLSLEPRLEELEQLMLTDPQDAMLAELISYKTDLRKFRRVFVYHVQIFNQLLAKQPPEFSTDRSHELKDLYEKQERAASLATLYYELATDLIDGYISLASHRLNNIIKILTIVTAIFVPLSFLAGLYGMNFENMPELQSKSGYFILLGVMATLVTILLLIFRRMRWL
ncbi:MAG: magnesium/cobalt transporter CorA [Gammaproteobacteria bacterium]|nr:magnesium/cobalt transporter CorA [Gammaproteobacteria bacterium]MDH3371549.1 magnesium/cobalt transporter CorA [Gammaproteobacteria bacterium]MDH3405588.1 magnesium/cobalt transporter CorA [Gammaproteobacteria bacterium]MDH3563021.1 magnesium/cobalt transporter CorA [Gammaproteobacteria bacterium]